MKGAINSVETVIKNIKTAAKEGRVNQNLISQTV